MGRYAESLLTNGEHVILHARQHWLAVLIEGRKAIALFLLSLVALILSQNLDSGPPREVFGLVTLAGLVLSLAWFGFILWGWFAQDYLITNRRVLKVEGIVNKRSADSSLEKINDAVLHQNLLGRILDFGDLDILTAADTAIDRYRMLDRAPAFKREMLNQKHELEGEFSRPLPSPPLRAPASPGVASAAGAGSTAVPAPGRGMSADEVTRALASLADLRDRGAITPEEYDAKKVELLARL